jgi:hypothetical protein
LHFCPFILKIRINGNFILIFTGFLLDFLRYFTYIYYSQLPVVFLRDVSRWRMMMNTHYSADTAAAHAFFLPGSSRPERSAKSVFHKVTGNSVVKIFEL